MRLDHLLSKEKVNNVKRCYSKYPKEKKKTEEKRPHESLFNFQCPKSTGRDVPRGMELHGGVAQLGEHLPCKQGVKGSNPFISTIKERSLRDGRTEIPEKNRSVAQVARAHA